MKLTEAQIAAVADQLKVIALDDDDDATIALAENYGDHTFYLDPGGLHIFEKSANADGVVSLVLVKIAEWADEQRSSLCSIEPELRPVFLQL